MERWFSSTDKHELLDRQLYECWGCGGDLSELGTLAPAHHILPYWAGGETVLENAVVLCPTCHVIWDNRAVIGEFWPDNNLTDFEPEQVRDEERFFEAFKKTYKNKQKNLLIK